MKLTLAIVLMMFRHRQGFIFRKTFGNLRLMATKKNILVEPTVVLGSGKAKLVLNGNPLVYGGAIKQTTGNPNAGSLVSVVDNDGQQIGRGVFNPHSMVKELANIA